MGAIGFPPARTIPGIRWRSQAATPARRRSGYGHDLDTLGAMHVVDVVANVGQQQSSASTRPTPIPRSGNAASSSSHRHHPPLLSSSQFCDHLLGRNPPVAIRLRDRIVELGLFFGGELEIV